MSFYTGVGSRKTPRAVQLVMQDIAIGMANDGYILRSGGAVGADTAFANGAGLFCEIYRTIGDTKFQHPRSISAYPIDNWDKAMDMAGSLHPAWHICSPFVKALHARNCFQILGYDLKTPSRIIICWTPDGAETIQECTRNTGGTGTAIKVADLHGIEVMNLQRPSQQARITEWLGIEWEF